MGEKKAGVVSIIVPVYNAEQFIRQTIDCVQAQTYTNWELLLVDDCSRDKSQEYIQEKVIELAKERMSDRRETVSRVAYSLGFQYPQHFCRLFKKRVGCTPNEYRAQNLLL